MTQATMYLVQKKIQYPLLRIEQAKTSAGSGIPDNWMACALDPHTKTEFFILINSDMLKRTGYQLMKGATPHEA